MSLYLWLHSYKDLENTNKSTELKVDQWLHGDGVGMDDKGQKETWECWMFFILIIVSVHGDI